jgi:ATP-binding cassette, subfamily B, multidrug efflux pump
MTTGPDDDVLGKAYDARLMRRFLGILRPHAGLATLCFAIVIVLAGVELLGPLVLRAAVDGPIAARDGDGAARWALLFGAVLAVQGGLEILNAWATGLAGQRVCRDLRRQVFGHLQRLPLAFHDRNPVGRLVTRVTSDIETLQELFASGFVAVAADVVSLAGIVGMLFWLCAPLAAAVFLVVPLLVAAAWVFRAHARRFYREIRQRIARLNACLNENVTGMRVVQLFNREARNRAVFERLNEEHRLAALASVRAYALFFPTINTLVLAAMALLIVAGGARILDGALSYGTFLAFWYYAQKFFHPVLDLAEKYNVLQSAMASSERIFTLLDTPPGVAPPAAPVRPAAPLRGEVELRDVTFAYEGGPVVLDRLSFRIAAGERVALVGPTGGGKTTTASLLSRLYDVRAGAVLVDGTDVRDYDPAWLRRQVGVVLQDVFCFAGTIASNLRLGETGIPRERLEAAARTANADRLIARRGGLDAPVPERGATLSAGEKQLLGLARALAFDPRILVLDEATSSVDPGTEALIREALRRAAAGRTALVIAHRLSTVQSCDRILVLHKGRVQEEGTHAELLRQGGLYATWAALQARSPAAAE